MRNQLQVAENLRICVLLQIVSYPAAEHTTQIVIANVGGQIANLTGFRLTDSDKRKDAAVSNHPEAHLKQNLCNTRL